jgi:hypothetical protein
MTFGTCNVRILCRSGLLIVAARELSRYIIDYVGVQFVRWDKVGTVRAGVIFFLWKRKQKSSLGNRSFCTPHNGISS